VRLETAVHDYISFTAPVYVANDLFDTEFHSFVHLPTGKRAIRTLQYSIPKELVSHVSVVQPSTSFDLAKPLGISVSYGKRDNVNASCANTIVPECLQDLYDSASPLNSFAWGFLQTYTTIVPTTPATQSSNRIAVPGFIDYWAQVINHCINQVYGILS